MKIDKDYLRVALILILMFVTSCTTEDPRFMTPPKKPVVAHAITEVMEQIKDLVD